MARPKKPTEHTVKKPSAAIQIEGKITLLQRKAWNVLLWNAYDALPTTDIYHISTLQAMRLVGYDSHDDAYFQAALEALSGTRVKWNVLEKDGSTDWGFAVLLASANIKNGVCSYGFAPHLRQKLYNPDMYARLDLDLQKRFESKHSLALWELCIDYLGAKRDYGETPWILLDDFRKLMGIEGGIYASFKRVTERVITPALAAINLVSDFSVTVGYQQKGRKVTALKFTMRRVVRLPELTSAPLPPCPETPVPAIVQELQDAGLSLHDALDLWQQQFAYVAEEVRPPAGHADTDEAFVQYVREKLHLLHRRQAAGKIEHTTGFLREAIRKNYANPEYAAAQQHEARRVEQQAVAAVERHRQELTQHKAAVEAGRDQALQTLCGSIVAEQPEVLEQAVAWALQDVPGFHLLYHREKTALDNYQGRVAIQAVLNPSIERQAPERFAEVREGYAAEITAIESQLRALQP